MRILVTGVAGFIGYHVARHLLDRGDVVLGIDNLNPFYDPRLKQDRLDKLQPAANFEFQRVDISDADAMKELFSSWKPESVIHLAAQAGVRYSIDNPSAYINSNVVGFLNILEGCRWNPVKHLVYASSSSVYGTNAKLPWSVDDNVDHPINIYAATKKSNELMAHSYSHLFGLPSTGLRFFTVYGPWGRPDMATYKFTHNIISDTPIDLYNGGNMSRDFTYVDDIVKGVLLIHDSPPLCQEGTAPYKIYNIGNHSPTNLREMIAILERCIGKNAIMNVLPMQKGDLPATFADIDDLTRDLGFQPTTPLEVGLELFVQWYREYHHA